MESVHNKTNDMIFLSAQPIDQYFLWQCEVQIVNFAKFGVDKNMQITVWYPKNREKELESWRKLQEKYPQVQMDFYVDEGVNLGLYIPQLRPHILKKHFRKYPYLAEEVIFYHDSDIIFNYLPDFEKLAEGPINWQSDCSSYLDYNYLRRKEKEGKMLENTAIEILACIGGIKVDKIKEYTGKTGGAQCILKNVDAKFWEDVENQVLLIRKAFSYNVKDSVNRIYFKSEAAGFQSWCADMWALNFALWKRGKVTDVTKELDFSWATDSYETYLQKPIYHNAGATRDKPELFYKGNWIDKSPIGEDITTKVGSASEQYVKAIKDVKIYKPQEIL